MLRPITFASLLVLALSPLAPAQAVVIFDSGVDESNANDSSPAYLAQYEIATQFDLTSEVTVREATLLGSAESPASFTLNFYADAAGAPAATASYSFAVASADYSTASATGGRLTYTLDFSDVVLAAGTWWFSAYASSAWSWGAANPTSLATQYRTAGSELSWTAYNRGHAFTLSDGAATTPIPLPAAAPLLAAGLAGLALVSRRRSRRAA